MVVKANADVIPRGVVYTLRSVLRGSGILTSTLYGCLYTPTWVFTLSVTTIGFLRPRIANRQKLSTHVFSFVVNRM